MNFNQIDGRKLMQEIIEDLINSVEKKDHYHFAGDIPLDSLMKISTSFWDENRKLDLCFFVILME